MIMLRSFKLFITCHIMLDNTAYTQIRLSKETREELKTFGNKASTYNEIIIALIESKKQVD